MWSDILVVGEQQTNNIPSASIKVSHSKHGPVEKEIILEWQYYQIKAHVNTIGTDDEFITTHCSH
jgi:hypothetical protein